MEFICFCPRAFLSPLLQKEKCLVLPTPLFPRGQGQRWSWGSEPRPWTQKAYFPVLELSQVTGGPGANRFTFPTVICEMGPNQFPSTRSWWRQGHWLELTNRSLYIVDMHPGKSSLFWHLFSCSLTSYLVTTSNFQVLQEQKEVLYILYPKPLNMNFLNHIYFILPCLSMQLPPSLPIILFLTQLRAGFSNEAPAPLKTLVWFPNRKDSLSHDSSTMIKTRKLPLI